MFKRKEDFNQMMRQGYVVCEGTTSFFRYPDAFETLIDYAFSKPAGTLSKFLFAPCSIGCEPYSFAMLAEKRGVFKRHPNLRLHGLDVSDTYIKLARLATYPLSELEEECTGFTINDENSGFFKVSDLIKSRVSFFPAQNILEHQPNGAKYDATMCFNLLEHMRAEENRLCEKIFNHLALITNGFLCVDYADSISRDFIIRRAALGDISFHPLGDNFHEAINKYGADIPQDEFRKRYIDGLGVLATMCLVQTYS